MRFPEVIEKRIWRAQLSGEAVGERIRTCHDVVMDPFGIRKLREKLYDYRLSSFAYYDTREQLSEAMLKRKIVLIATVLSAAAVAGAIGMYWMADRDRRLTEKE